MQPFKLLSLINYSSHVTWVDDQTFISTLNIGDIVVISHGQHVTLDVDTPLLKALVIMGGTLEFDREIASKVTLMAEYIIVTQGGHFMIGTEENPFPCDKEAGLGFIGTAALLACPSPR